MKSSDLVYREILYQAMEKENRTMTQAAIARRLALSLSTINRVVRVLERMGAVDIRPRGFRVLDVKKVLYHWATVRNLYKDIIYQTRVDAPVRDIERNMPEGIVFTAYSAHKLKFKDVPADYSEVYVYGDDEVEQRFPYRKGVPNLYVLRKDHMIAQYGGTATIANTFADLWNLREWYAKEFIKALEARLHGILE